MIEPLKHKIVRSWYGCDKEVASVIEKISGRVIRHLRRKGYFDKDAEVIDNRIENLPAVGF